LGLAVRTANSLYARKLTVIPHREVVCGRKSGHWLALVGQPGFMLCEMGHREILKKLKTTQTAEQCRVRVAMQQITSKATTTSTKIASTVTATTAIVTTQTTRTSTSAPTTTTPTETEITSATTTTRTATLTTTIEASNAVVVDSLWVSATHPSNSSRGTASLSSTSPKANTIELPSTTSVEGALNTSTLDATITSALHASAPNSSTAKGDSDLTMNASGSKGDSEMELATNEPSISSIERGSDSSSNQSEATSNTIFTVPGQSIEEIPSQLEWQVVSPGKVHIRMAKRPSAAVSGLVPTRGIFLGTREGNWIKLFRRAGFFMVDKGGVRVIQRAVSYSWLPEGSTSCTEKGKFPIKDASVCEAAAETLGLRSTCARLGKQSPLPEVGCFSDSDGVLWYLSGPSSDTSMATKKHSLRPLCASRDYLASDDLAEG